MQFRILLTPSPKKNAELDHIQSEIKANITLNSEDFSAQEILHHIIKAEEETNNLLLIVFNNFDKAGVGFIELEEIETICRELGVDVTHAEFQETLRSLDINHDNKIGFDEFFGLMEKRPPMLQANGKLNFNENLDKRVLKEMRRLRILAIYKI